MANNQELYPDAYEICKQFELDNQDMQEIVSRMDNEIRMGLSRDTHGRAVIKCWVTYVQDLPTGTERGNYLALDLGGTNFRVLMVTLKDENQVSMISKTYVMQESLITGPGIMLFDYIVECLANFVVEHGVENEYLPLGFTFSFPVRQVGLASGILVAWTKGFNCSGVVGEDVVHLLEEAIARHGNLKIKVVAILNDTTGTLMSCAFLHRNCRIGLIVGTGSNACYVERTSNVEMFTPPAGNTKPYMIINCEWGAFGDNGVLDFVRTDYDRIVDRQTFNVGKQLYEKCISGMYLGELVRLILLDLMKAGKVFVGQNSDRMNNKWSLETKFISEIESDPPGVYLARHRVMERMGLRNCQQYDLDMVLYICQTISKRSAKLCACGLACLTNRMKNPNISIGVDGGVYRYHPHYHNLLLEYMKKLVLPNLKYELVSSDDGSGRGAALIAACAVSKV